MHNLHARSLSVPLLATMVLLAGAIVAPAQQPAKPIAPKNAAHPPSPIRLAAIIDGILQPRFQEDAGVFGMSRTYGVDVIGGHQYVLFVLDEADTSRNMPANKPFTTDVGREYIIGFFRFAKRPGKYVAVGMGQPPPNAGRQARPVYQEIAWQRTWQQEEAQKTSGIDAALQCETDQGRLQKSVQAFCLNSLPNVKQGSPCDAMRDGWLIAIRPIKATKTLCLHCHAGAKLNDALGAMVYTVRLDPVRPLAKKPLLHVF